MLFNGGDEEDRTLDLTDANRTLSQLSYIPTKRLLYYITPTCQKKQEEFQILFDLFRSSVLKSVCSGDNAYDVSRSYRFLHSAHYRFQDDRKQQ